MNQDADDEITELTEVDEIANSTEVDDIEVEEAVEKVRKLTSTNSTKSEVEDMSTDLLQIFLRDVGKFPLLTGPQEVALAKRIKGNDPRDVKKAKDALANHNLRMVISVANQYHRGMENHGISYLDLIQEGMLGLLRAVELYDHTKTNVDGVSYKFSTYAMWWIRQSIRRGRAEKSRNIKVPMHIIDKLGKITEAEEELHLAFGREPTIQELAAHLGMKPSSVAEILRGTQIPISLDRPMTDSREDTEEAELGHVLYDEITPSPHEVVSAKIESEILTSSLSKLSARNLDILEHRFGLNGKPMLNLTDIGKIWGITYQRVRQIETDILANLRANADIQVLRED